MQVSYFVHHFPPSRSNSGGAGNPFSRPSSSENDEEEDNATVIEDVAGATIPASRLSCLAESLLKGAPTAKNGRVRGDRFFYSGEIQEMNPFLETMREVVPI
jgi:hypothetical protein